MADHARSRLRLIAAKRLDSDGTVALLPECSSRSDPPRHTRASLGSHQTCCGTFSAAHCAFVEMTSICCPAKIIYVG